MTIATAVEHHIKRYRWVLFSIIALGALVWSYEYWTARKEARQAGYIVAAAQRYGVPPALIKAVVWRESRFNPRAHGKAGEIGLMQIAALAAKEWADAEKLALFEHEDLYDPEQNTLAGAWYLRKLLKRYARADDPLPYALADYNAGRSNVLRWNKGFAATNSQIFINEIDFPSTKRYVQAVVKRYGHYQAEERAAMAKGLPVPSQ